MTVESATTSLYQIRFYNVETSIARTCYVNMWSFICRFFRLLVTFARLLLEISKITSVILLISRFFALKFVFTPEICLICEFHVNIYNFHLKFELNLWVLYRLWWWKWGSWAKENADSCNQDCSRASNICIELEQLLEDVQNMRKVSYTVVY